MASGTQASGASGMGHNATIALSSGSNGQRDEFLDLTRQRPFGHGGLGEISKGAKNVGNFVT